MKKLILIFLLSFTVSAEQPVLTYSQNIIAQTLLGEARGEGEAGMYAVACVIQRRVINRGMTAHKVCLQSKQFSCWNDGKESNSLDTTQGIYAKYLAINLHRLQLSYVKDADHYCTLRTHNYWTKGRKPVAVIGNHKFYKLK
jgi:spore germination cell wall hydrolase CwlJ-like protein